MASLLTTTKTFNYITANLFLEGYTIIVLGLGARLRNLLEKYLLYVRTIKLFFGLLSITLLEEKVQSGLKQKKKDRKNVLF